MDGGNESNPRDDPIPAHVKSLRWGMFKTRVPITCVLDCNGLIEKFNFENGKNRKDEREVDGWVVGWLLSIWCKGKMIYKYG